MNAAIAIQQAESHGHHIIDSAVVSYSTSIFPKRDGIALVCHDVFEIYPPEKTEYTYSLPWLTIKTVSVNKKIIKLVFNDKTISLETNYFKKFFGALCHAIVQTHSNNEISDIGLNDFRFGRQQQSGVGALVRLNQLADIRNDKVPKQSLKHFRNMLVYRNPLIDITNFSDQPIFIQCVLDALPLCSSAQQVIMPKISKLDTYQLLCDYVNNLKNIYYLEIHGRNIHRFENFTEELSKINTNISGISFVDAKFSERGLIGLSKYIERSTLPGITFDNSIPQDVIDILYKKFFRSSIQQNIASLAFKRTQNLQLHLLLPKILNLISLSLVDCGLQVSDIMYFASNLKSLKYIDISNNKCATLSSSPLPLPPLLTTIVANDIVWFDTCLEKFLRSVTVHTEYGFKLSINSAKASDDEFIRAFQLLRNSPCQACLAFHWDNNPVNPMLFDFLEQQRCLGELSLHGNFSSSNQDDVILLANYIASAPSIGILDISGTKNMFLGNQSSLVIRALSTTTTITTLDISKNQIGDAGLIILKQLFTTPNSLEIIDFDGQVPTKVESLIDIMELAAKTQNKLKVSFPSADFGSLISKRKITPSSYHSIVAKYQKPPISPDSRGADFPIPDPSPFFKPFYIFKYFKDPLIPVYFTRDQVDTMRRVPPPTFNMILSTAKAAPKSAAFLPSNVQETTTMIVGASASQFKAVKKFAIEPVAAPIPKEMLESDTSSDDDIFAFSPEKKSGIARQNVFDALKEHRRKLNDAPKPVNEPVQIVRVVKGPEIPVIEAPSSTSYSTLPSPPTTPKRLLPAESSLGASPKTPPQSPVIVLDDSPEKEIDSPRSRYSTHATRTYDPFEEEEDEEDDDEDTVAHQLKSQSATTTGTCFSSRLPFTGKYEYYSSSDSYYEEEDYTDSPVNSPSAVGPSVLSPSNFSQSANPLPPVQSVSISPTKTTYRKDGTETYTRPPPIQSPPSFSSKYNNEYYSSDDDYGYYSYDSDGISHTKTRSSGRNSMDEEALIPQPAQLANNNNEQEYNVLPAYVDESSSSDDRVSKKRSKIEENRPSAIKTIPAQRSDDEYDIASDPETESDPEPEQKPIPKKGVRSSRRSIDQLIEKEESDYNDELIYGSRVRKPRQQKLPPPPKPTKDSSIYGSRVRPKINDNTELNDTKNDYEKQIYGSRTRRRRNESDISNAPGSNSKASNIDTSSIYGSRVRTRRPLPSTSQSGTTTQNNPPLRVPKLKSRDPDDPTTTTDTSVYNSRIRVKKGSLSLLKTSANPEPINEPSTEMADSDTNYIKPSNALASAVRMRPTRNAPPEIYGSRSRRGTRDLESGGDSSEYTYEYSYTYDSDVN